MVQGAVSSSSRIMRVKNIEIEKNAKSFVEYWGSGGLNLNNPNPYFLKSKYSNPNTVHRTIDGKTLCTTCPPKPPSVN